MAKKIQLNKKTMRVLSADETMAVAGGYWTAPYDTDWDCWNTYDGCDGGWQTWDGRCMDSWDCPPGTEGDGCTTLGDCPTDIDYPGCGG